MFVGAIVAIHHPGPSFRDHAYSIRILKSSLCFIFRERAVCIYQVLEFFFLFRQDDCAFLFYVALRERDAQGPSALALREGREGRPKPDS